MERVGNMLIDLAACLQVQVNESDVPDVCFLGVVPGAFVAQEYAGDCNDACGMAWVRLVNSYPASTLGVQNVLPGNCNAGIGLTLEVGMMRCFYTGEQPPDETEMLEATIMQMDDMAVMRRAIYCCDALPAEDYTLGIYTPQGPQGGLVGGTWQVTVGIV